MSYTFMKNFQNIQTSYIQEIDLHIYEDIAKLRKMFFYKFKKISYKFRYVFGGFSFFSYPLVCFLWLLRLGGASHYKKTLV